MAHVLVLAVEGLVLLYDALLRPPVWKRVRVRARARVRAMVRARVRVRVRIRSCSTMPSCARPCGKANPSLSPNPNPKSVSQSVSHPTPNSGPKPNSTTPSCARPCGRQPPGGFGQLALQHAPPAPEQAQGGLQPRPSWQIGSSCPAISGGRLSWSSGGRTQLAVTKRRPHTHQAATQLCPKPTLPQAPSRPQEAQVRRARPTSYTGRASGPEHHAHTHSRGGW